MSKFLDLKGLQEYSSKLKEYIGLQDAAVTSAVTGTADDASTALTLNGIKKLAQSAVDAAGVTKFGGKTGEITVAAESSTKGDVNLTVSDAGQLSAAIVADSFDEYGAADAVLGTSADAATADTVYGAKAAAKAAQDTADAAVAKTSIATSISASTSASDEKVASEKAVATAVETAKKDILTGGADATIDAAYDTLKEVADWIASNDGDSASDAGALITKVNANTTAIGTENTAAEGEASNATGIYAKIEAVEAVAEAATHTKTAVAASSTNGHITVDGSDVTVYTEVENTVHDANYAHITVTSSSVSDGTNTFEKYVHPTTTAVTAAAVKVGNDSEGHVVLGAALTAGDIAATASDAAADGSSVAVSGDTVSSQIASLAASIASKLDKTAAAAKVANALTINNYNASGVVAGETYDGSAAVTIDCITTDAVDAIFGADGVLVVTA